MIAEKNRRNEKQRFAIRKLNVGVASVLLGITFSIYGGGQVIAHADTVNTSDQVATSGTGDDNLAEKPEVALSGGTSSANQSSTSATNANGTVQSEASANSKTATPATTSASATASNATVEATKDQSTAKIQSSDGQEVQTSAQAQPVTQENGSSDASLNTTRQVLHTIANRNLVLAANNSTSLAAPASGVVTLNATTPEAEDPNAVTVRDAQGLIDAIQKEDYTTINIGSDINLNTVATSNWKDRQKISTLRNITFQSVDPNKKYNVDFGIYSFNMNSKDYGVTFKNLNLYGLNYFGAIMNAGSYTFDNVNYTGSQLVYTDSNFSGTTVKFIGNVTANSVISYVNPTDKKTYWWIIE